MSNAPKIDFRRKYLDKSLKTYIKRRILKKVDGLSGFVQLFKFVKHVKMNNSLDGKIF